MDLRGKSRNVPMLCQMGADFIRNRNIVKFKHRNSLCGDDKNIENNSLYIFDNNLEI